MRAGEDISVIQSLSGHSSADMILRYSIPSEEDKQKVVDQIYKSLMCIRAFEIIQLFFLLDHPINEYLYNEHLMIHGTQYKKSEYKFYVY